MSEQQGPTSQNLQIEMYLSAYEAARRQITGATHDILDRQALQRSGTERGPDEDSRVVIRQRRHTRYPEDHPIIDDQSGYEPDPAVDADTEEFPYVRYVSERTRSRRRWLAVGSLFSRDWHNCLFNIPGKHDN